MANLHLSVMGAFAQLSVMGAFAQLSVMGAFAQLSVMGAFRAIERELIRERQREGIELAKRAGAYKGRKRPAQS